MTVTSDDNGDDDDDRTPYSNMSGHEFLDELRRHQTDEDWTLGHWVELERRGFDILDSDPELAAAVRAQYERFTAAMQEALAPIREQMAENFRAIMPNLADLMPKIDYSKFFPKTDFSQLFPDIDLSSLVPKYELDLPTFDLLPQRDFEEFVPPNYLNLHADSVLDHQDTIASLAESKRIAGRPRSRLDRLRSGQQRPQRGRSNCLARLSSATRNAMRSCSPGTTKSRAKSEPANYPNEHSGSDSCWQASPPWPLSSRPLPR